MCYDLRRIVVLQRGVLCCGAIASPLLLDRQRANETKSSQDVLVVYVYGEELREALRLTVV